MGQTTTINITYFTVKLSVTNQVFMQSVITPIVVVTTVTAPTSYLDCAQVVRRLVRRGSDEVEGEAVVSQTE